MILLIAPPAYVSTVCFAIVLLYSNDDDDGIKASFYAQVLSVYSYVIAVIIAIAEQQLTRLHATFALVAAGSPLSLYLLIYALLWIFKVLKKEEEEKEPEKAGEGHAKVVVEDEKVVKDDYAITEQGAGTVRKLDKEETAKTEKKKKRERERRERERKNVHRLHNIFGDGQYLNRALILAIVPAWFAVLVFICLQADEFKFQQAACDAVFKNHLVGSFFYGPLLVFVGAPPPAIITGALLLGLLVLSWMVGAYRHRDKIWEGHNPKRFPLMKIWSAIFVFMVTH